MKVLLVDDDPGILEQAKIFLEREEERLDIDTATSAEEALELLENNAYDGIISDYQMPEMNGLEFLEVIREDRNTDIPFIIFTGRGREKVAIKALNLGADRYLQKGGSPKSQYSVLARAIVQEIEHSKSEERLILALEGAKAAKAGLWDWYVQTGETEINERWAEIVGYELEELEPVSIETWRELAHPEDLERSDELLEKHFAGETDYYEFEGRMKHKNGDWVWIQDRGRVVKWDDEGNPVRMVGTRIDVIDQKEAEEKYIFESNLLNALLNNADDLVYFKDREGRYLRVSEAYADALGLEREEVKGKTAFELYPENQAKQMHEDDMKVMEKGVKVVDREHKVTLDGETRWLSTTKVPRYDDGGNVIGMAGISRDITERKRVEEELKESEEEYRKLSEEFDLILDHIPGLVFYKDPENNFIRVNKRLAEAHGMTKEELEGKSLFELYPEEEAQEYWEDDKEVIESGEPKLNIVEPWSPEEKRWVSTSKIPYTENGEVKGIIGISIDITERKEAEEELKRSEDELETITSGVSDAIVMIDSEGVVKFWNEEAEDMFNYSEEEALGEEVHPLLAPDKYFEDYNRGLEYFKETGDGRVIGETVELDALKKDGTTFPVELTVSSLKVDGEPHAIAVIRDITERKEAEEREEYLHSLLRHDVRNKNQIVQGYLELSKDYDLPEELEEHISKAEEATKNSVEIIEKVRTLLEVGGEEKIGEVGVESVIKNVIGEWESRASEKGISIEYEDCECKVRVGSLLRELFSNLLENSIVHSGCEKIRVGFEETEGECIVTVEDDGRGISEEDKDKIFERGFKKGETAGTGLGTYLVKEIAGSYGGGVEVKDSELGGARFDVYLKKA